ncbi:MAG: tripartite tricarboxylate transporter TctB family protein, partial [Gemmatimonadaceae bacterium]
ALLASVVGFVAASTVLFACTATAFRAQPVIRVVAIGLAFSAAVFVLFRFGLDVPLETGTLWERVGR